MIKAANPRVLLQALNRKAYYVAYTLVEKGIDANRVAAEIIPVLTQSANNRGYFNILLNKGMKINCVNYSVMHSCIKTDSPEQAKLLLDGGMDLDMYAEWAISNNAIKEGETYAEVLEYWETKIKNRRL
jgi:hypothetical protein